MVDVFQTATDVMTLMTVKITAMKIHVVSHVHGSAEMQVSGEPGSKLDTDRNGEERHFA